MKKVGVLGTAHGHLMAFTKEWRTHPEYEVVVTGVWDHNPEQLAKVAPVLEAPAFASPEALLASDIDAVVICAETAYHCELVEKAAAAGKDIILYKPMALTMEQADRIVDAVEKSGVAFTMGWQMRVDPQNQKIRALIQSGELGKVYLFRRRHCLGTHTWAGFENTWHNDPQMNRDIFADDSSHPIDMIHWIFGVPETVSCEMSTMHNPKVPNDTGVALFKYANGLIVEISCSFVCSATEITTEVYLEKGAIQQYFGDGPSTRLPHGTEGLKYFKEGDTDWTIVRELPSPASHGERLQNHAEPFADFLHHRRGPICSAEEARLSLRMVLACYLSVREGCRVNIMDSRVYEI